MEYSRIMERDESLPSLLDFIDELEVRFNQFEPQVMAFVPEANRFERLRLEAQLLLDRYARPDSRPALWGIPVGVKDVIHVEGFTTRAGSRVPAGVLQGAEAECVSRLKQAGALIIGKTSTTEFAYTAPAPTRNPHHLDHTPGGSSSGSAAAVAAGLCPLALGTQTSGSLMRPAAFCGVVAFKPSYDRISRQGVIPLAPSLDHVGFFASDLTLAARAAGILCKDWRPANLAQRKPTLGIPEGLYLMQASHEARSHLNAVCRRLIDDGYDVKRVACMPDFDDLAERHALLLTGEAAQTHAAWFAAYGDYYQPETARMIRHGQQVAADALERARSGREQLRAELTSLMDEFGLDLWLSPAAPGGAPRCVRYTGNAIMNLPWTHSGLPAVNLPVGQNSNGLPLGLQVTTRWHADEQLLAWSAMLERSLRSRD